MLKILAKIWHAKDLRNKILFTVFIVFCFRFLGHITIPGIDTSALKESFAQKNNILGVFSAFTGGSIENFSIMLLGLSPYINASIIIQLMTVISPRIASWKEEGEEGRRKMNKWTRYLTIPLAFVQSYGMILLLNNSVDNGLISNVYAPSIILPMMIVATTGTILAVWLGELITEKGLGNGVSILIFVGIVSNIPQVIGGQLGVARLNPEAIYPFLILTAITIALTIFVILVTEGLRHVPITYAGRRTASGEQASIPVRINQAGMIPIIFAVSMVTFPSILAKFFVNSPNETVRAVADFITANFSSNTPNWLYISVFFALTIFFTFFYVSITFQPEQIAESIQKRGGFIPGIRPGRHTAEYLQAVSSRLNLWGGLFIGFVAVLPMILNKFFSQLGLGTVQLLISGAGIIIIVGVALELFRQINSNLAMHDYEKLY